MVGTEASRLSTFSIGNCKVEIQGECLIDESKGKDLVILAPKDARIGISEIEDDKCLEIKNYSFCLLHPKDIDSPNTSLLQEVLELYSQELPTMAYAANTGRNSDFLKKCIFNGKYKTLIIRSTCNGLGEVIAAVSYQIIPTDTQYAEIPLAVVRSCYQKKGYGQIMYKELSRRLQSVGVLSIFCWADDVSEGFWLKQGYVLVGEVDSKGKARKLSVKADIKKMLCFPGASKLMVSHLKKDLLNCINSSLDARIPNSDAKFPSTIPDSIAYDSYDLNEKDTAAPEKGIKRQMWEGSSTSLRSKRVRGDHATNNSQNLKGDINNHSLKEISHKIMFMNMADDAKKTCLTKIVDDLGGTVTSDGSICTHVITGKARRTMNFCVALSSGAWVVSSSWLKASFKEGCFVDEANYILEDEDYLTKYKCELRDAVARARANPCALFSGYSFCFTKHIQPSIDNLSAIIKSCGGNVIGRFDESENTDKIIFMASEEDMKDALDASKRGVRVFSSEWLMNCVMKQELDLEAPQFAESL
ncbi:Mediator of DNA damage checkpoint protein 1 [Carex littledalei]|uniref:Mediator of DNA damage checkpoint protein 1 n=1 Tax=Carex littledalei TaxID=544730 RepID=A0A833RJI1_9POAL|nr:Mediator of DNA damage checkpoint protein 1 [Carex littledalei]